MRGWLSYISASKTLSREVEGYHRLYTLLDAYRDRRVVEFDAATAEIFERLRRSKLRIGTMDLKIAASAIRHSATLISENLTDFGQIPGLDVEDWTR
jgi:tRNA(fMet)-specific endonuclease VapC